MTVSPVAERVTESFIDGTSVRSAETYPNIDPSTRVPPQTMVGFLSW